MTGKHLPQASVGEFLLFQSDDGRARVECRYQPNMLWLTQASMAELYDKDVRTINKYPINTIAKGELALSRTIRKFRMVRQEGKLQVSRAIEHYKGV